MKNSFTDDLLQYIDASPSPYHAVTKAAERLEKAKFSELRECDEWKLEAGKAYFVTRSGGSIIAFRLPADKNDLAQAGFHIIGAHTDSPCLKLKPESPKSAGNWLQWSVEIYGGVLLNSWIDRDLHLSGRLTISTEDGLKTRLISLRDKRFRVPQLAIHLNRGVNQDGLKLNAQNHLTPIIGLGSEEEFQHLILDAAGLGKDDWAKILGQDLMFHDATASEYGGLQDEFIYAPRLDNLAMTHAAVEALINEPEVHQICVAACFDHEEVGSTSDRGACSNFMPALLERVALSLGRNRQAYLATLNKSFLISADMAHAIHPNYPEIHDSLYAPEVNKGPVVKLNSNMRYTSDSFTTSYFKYLCDKTEVPVQIFFVKNDCPCGSTIGPMTSAELGITAVDIGNPMLSMHSAREMAGSDDHPLTYQVFRKFFTEKQHAMYRQA